MRRELLYINSCPTIKARRKKAYRIPHNACCPTRNRALLHNNRPWLRRLGNHLGGALQRDHVRRCSRALARDLGRGVDGQEHHIGLGNASSDLGGEEKIRNPRGELDVLPWDPDGVRAVTRDSHDFAEAGLVDREVLRVPSVDTGLVFVYDGDADVWVRECDDCCGGTSCNACLSASRL